MGQLADEPLVTPSDPVRAPRRVELRIGALAAGLAVLVSSTLFGGAWAGWSHARRASPNTM